MFLDIDLDFFLDKIAHYNISKRRLSSRDYKPWATDEVRAFLEERCGLRRSVRVPGRLVQGHDGAVDYWLELRQSGALAFPFDLVHVDAHADLGLGGPSWKHILTDLLHQPLNKRETSAREHLNLGNFLAYAIACRWIRSVDYVHPIKGGSDVHNYFLKDFRNGINLIEMRALRLEDVANYTSIARCPPVALEPQVPFRPIPYRDWKAAGAFSHALLCQSPGYTPITSDALIPIFEEYIDFG